MSSTLAVVTYDRDANSSLVTHITIHTERNHALQLDFKSLQDVGLRLGNSTTDDASMDRSEFFAMHVYEPASFGETFVRSKVPFG